MPLPQELPAAQLHTSNDDDGLSHIGRQSLIGISSQSKNHQTVVDLPAEDTNYLGGRPGDKEDMSHRPNATRGVRHSVVNAQHDESVRPSIFEQARPYPARHLAV
ncbi:hypothetical protein F5X98DRAFT_387829 [Xylaria grammica]|nr:hypothetical protein F5X98DRAFT_387829 [Xylaria grammica]